MKVPAMYPLNCQYPLANLPGAEVRRVVVDPDFPCIGGLSSKWPLKVNCCDNRINLIIPLRRLYILPHFSTLEDIIDSQCLLELSHQMYIQPQMNKRMDM